MAHLKKTILLHRQDNFASIPIDLEMANLLRSNLFCDLC